jgi:hypothetical protein
VKGKKRKKKGKKRKEEEEGGGGGSTCLSVSCSFPVDSYSILSLLVDDHRDSVASFLGRKNKFRKNKTKQP